MHVQANTHTRSRAGVLSLPASAELVFPAELISPARFTASFFCAAKMCLHLALAEPREGGGLWGRLAKHCLGLSPEEEPKPQELGSFLILRVLCKMFSPHMPIPPSPSSSPLPQHAEAGSNPVAPQGSPKLPAGYLPYGYLVSYALAG